MNIDHLNQSWDKLQSLRKQDMGLRVSGECQANLYLSIDSLYKHSLILWVKNPPQEISVFENQNIKLNFDKNCGYLTLSLLNRDYLKLFNDLILDIHSKVKDLRLDEQALNCFLNSAYKWAELFSGQDSESQNLKRSELQ